MTLNLPTSDPLWQTLADIDAEQSADFRTLAGAAKLDPAIDFRNVSLAGLSLEGQDLSGFDFSGTDLRGTNLRRASSVNGLVISKSTVLDPADRKWLWRRLSLGKRSRRDKSHNFPVFLQDEKEYKPLILISYAHQDEPEKPAEGEVKWLSFVTGYLRPAIKQGAVDLWLDRLMPGGADWEREIEQKLAACDIFILLVSRHSLSSDYVVDKEIAIIRERQAKGEAVQFYPLILTPTPNAGLDLVRDKNLRPRDGKPFSDYAINERYRHMHEAADEIAEICGKIAARRSTPTPGSLTSGLNAVYDQLGGFTSSPMPPTPMSPPVEEARGTEPEIKGRESLEAWLSGQDREVVIAMAARTALRVAPLVVREQASTEGNVNFEILVSTIFSASAFAWVASRYPFRANELAAAASRVGNTAHALANSDLGSVTLTATTAAATAANAVADTGRIAIALADRNASVAESIIAAVVGSVAACIAFAASALAPGWEQVRADIAAFRKLDPCTVANQPLWSHETPDWAADAWLALKAALPLSRDWQVWIDWYENRLRGGSRGEAYELVFASAPQEVWNKGPAESNAWIREHLPPLPADESHAKPVISDKESLEAWLKGQRREVAIAIAARAALRVAPLAVRLLRNHQSVEAFEDVATPASAIFRSCASARLGARYPVRITEFRKAARVAASRAEGIAASGAVASVPAVASATSSAAFAAYAAFAVSGGNIAPVADSVTTAVAAASNADARDPAASIDAMWEEVRVDAASIEGSRVNPLSDSPLWSNGAPEWASLAWSSLQEALPDGKNWEVWTDWYNERLRGVSRGEDYEVVFASVPLDLWDKGPAAANAWINAHLPKASDATHRAELPAPLPGLDAPFAYGWTASQRVAVVAGAQNLPFYPHFSSEEDHRRALEAARVGGERLLKALRDGRYNARPEYGEALEYYLEDLPKTAGAGNILLANDQIRILHAMLLADADTLPEGFASRLKSVIANQFALNAFYDLV